MKCPNCGAPLPVGDPASQRATICLYCDHSVVLQAAAATTIPPSGAELAGQVRAVSAAEPECELGRQVKALVASGRWKEAVGAYARATGTTEADAGVAIAEIVHRLPGTHKLLRRAPLDVIVLGFVIVVLAVVTGAGLTWALPRALLGRADAIALAIGCVGLIALFVNWAVPKVISTWVFYMGAEGRGTVLRRAVITSDQIPKGCVMLLVHFQVDPVRGDLLPFEDEEAMLVYEHAVAKFAPGNVVRVRFSRRTGRTFPVRPVEVLGATAAR